MANVQAFNPVPDSTQKCTMTGSSVPTGSALFVGGGYRQVRIMNNGTATVWIKFGGSSVTADTTNDIPVPSGAVEVLTVPGESNGTYAAAIAAGATGDVYFTPGSGL